MKKSYIYLYPCHAKTRLGLHNHKEIILTSKENTELYILVGIYRHPQRDFSLQKLCMLTR